MRLPVHDVQVAMQSAVARRRFDARAQARCGGDNKLQRRPRRQHTRGGREEQRREVIDFRAATARQNGQDSCLVVQPKAAPRRRPVRLHRDQLRQRMADKGTGDPLAFQQLRLKRKNAQHMIGRAAQQLHALRTPGPHRRTDKVHGFYSAGTQVRFQRQVEIGGVYADKYIGWSRDQPLA